MKLNRVKLFAIILFALPVFALAIFNFKPAVTTVKAADAAEIYKTKCQMCHGQKSEKHFNTEMKDEELVPIILNGKKAEKPPNMPEYASKGITEEQAKELVTYMRGLAKPSN